MDEPLDEQYLQWLYQQVASIRFKNPARTYWSLIRQLYIKEFVWLVRNDDNRVEDGRDLRYEFIEDNDIDPDPEWMGLGCSMLEMLIALSRRLAFESSREPRDWFWTLLENVDLRRFNDAYYKTEAQAKLIDETLDDIIWRNYQSDGHGGLFPLNDAQKDQRNVELWYQSAAYLIEQDV